MINITYTGVWYLFIANCEDSSRNKGLVVSVDGTIEWKNPFGYLPGQVAPNLFVCNLAFFLLITQVYWGLFVALLLLLIVYVGYAIYHRSGLLGLQYAIGAVILLFAIEQMIWGIGLILYNYGGTTCILRTLTHQCQYLS